MNAEKFTQKTIETINTAQAMAQENQNQYLTPAHLLYALIDQDGGLIGSLLSKMGADCDAMLGELDAEIAKLPKVSGGSGEVYASPETSKLLRFAEKAAEKLGDEYVSVEHLMLGMFSEGGPGGAQDTLRPRRHARSLQHRARQGQDRPRYERQPGGQLRRPDEIRHPTSCSARVSRSSTPSSAVTAR